MNEWELLDDGKVTNTVDFGRPDTGTISKKTLQLHNKSYDYDIENITLDKILDKDVMIDYPVKIKANMQKPVTITWNPKFERRKPLDITNLFTGDLMIG